MSDRELLEQAARAYWAQELADDEVSIRYGEEDEAIEMAYENVLAEAKGAIKGVRRPTVTKARK
ncbi:MAG: hypothetical protein WAQ08_15995 [Aquabacterium sp.]|uniref:hypothetical protein n=1 Tax=Aquabacterium sp. TaxID=1872578 RepID=UPI003BB1173C